MTSLPASGFPEARRAVHPFLLGLLRGSDSGAPSPWPREEREWEEILKQAAAQGLTPALYRWRRSGDAGQRLPSRLAERLERDAAGVAARNLVLADELAQILRAFERRQVRCAPIRGLALAERLYGDIAARPMGDLDLLVPKRDLPEVATALRGLGYREMDRRPGFARAFSYTLKFIKERHGWVIVEPHWTLAYPPFVDRIDMDGVWARCARGQVVGVETWLLASEELLLHLCLHLSHRDGTAPLLWFYEADRLLRREGAAFDWSRFSSLAREADLERLLFPVLETVRALFTTPIPDRVLDQPTRERPRRVEGRLIRLLTDASAVDGKESLAVLLTLKGLRAKLRYARDLLFPTPEFMRLQYGLTGRSQLGSAYVRRFCRLSWEGLNGAVRLLARPDHPAEEEAR